MSWTVELESSAAAHKIFSAAVLDLHNLGPRIAPEVLESGTVEGIIRQLNFTSAMPFTHVKERMNFVDHRKFECRTTVTEGGHIGTKFESASVNYKIDKAATGEGCNIKVVITTKPLPGIEVNDESTEVITKAKEAMVKHLRLVEAYLLANPEKYNAAPPPSKKLIQVYGTVHGTVHGDALVVGDDGESQPRYSGGNTVGIQVYGTVNGEVGHQSGGTYSAGSRPNFNTGWGYAYGRGGY